MVEDNNNQKVNEEITAKHVGIIKIGEIEIKCAVLSNEKRVFFPKRNCWGINWP